MTPAVFLDRDGVLIHLEWDQTRETYAAPLRSDSVRLQTGVRDGLRRLRQRGYLLVLASNQPDAATGRTTLEALSLVHSQFDHLLGVKLDGYYYCFHHPEGTQPELGIDCSCRKPKPGMLLQAAEHLRIDLACSWMVGDRDKDSAAGEAAGCKTVQIGLPVAPNRLTRPTRVVTTFAEAVEAILDADLC